MGSMYSIYHMSFVRADLNKLTEEERKVYNGLSFKQKNSYQGGQILTDEESAVFDKLYAKATAAGGGVSKQSKKRHTSRRRRSSKARKARKARKTRTTRRK